MSYFLWILFYVALAFIFYFSFKLKTKEEKEYEAKLKKSLEEEYIIDPETGVKLTLEQAESGHWIAHDNEFYTKSDEEIASLLTEKEIEQEKVLNYLRESKEYRKTKFSEEDLLILESTKILNKYNDWTLSIIFKIAYLDGVVFFPFVVINDRLPAYFSNDYKEKQMMVWIRLNKDLGHHYFREKSVIEKFIGIWNKNNTHLKGYEVYTFEKGENTIELIRLLKNFQGIKGLEIEILGENLLIKNLKHVNSFEFFKIESILKKWKELEK